MGKYPSNLFSLFTGKAFSIRVKSDIHNAQINAKSVDSINLWWFRNIAGYRQIEVFALHLQVNFAFAVSEQGSLIITADEGDFLSTIYSPNGNCRIIDETKNPVIKWLCCMLAKRGFVLLVCLVTGRYFCNTSHDYLCRQICRLSYFVINGFMKTVLSEYFVFPSNIADFVASGIRRSQRHEQGLVLLGRRHELYGSNQFHRWWYSRRNCQLQGLLTSALLPALKDGVSVPAFCWQTHWSNG